MEEEEVEEAGAGEEGVFMAVACELKARGAMEGFGGVRLERTRMAAED